MEHDDECPIVITTPSIESHDLSEECIQRLSSAVLVETGNHIVETAGVYCGVVCFDLFQALKYAEFFNLHNIHSFLSDSSKQKQSQQLELKRTFIYLTSHGIRCYKVSFRASTITRSYFALLTPVSWALSIHYTPYHDKIEFQPRLSIRSTLQGTNWMRYIDDNLPISMLTIPGSHNTCAVIEPRVLHLNTSIAKCQHLSLIEQLNAGVRFVDIRCQIHKSIPGLPVFHGPIYQKTNLHEVIAICKAFLDQNPSEFILFSLKQENSHQPDAFVDRVVSVLCPSPSTATASGVGMGAGGQNTCSILADTPEDPHNLWYFDNKIPTVQQVRGRIILVRRFSRPTTPSPFGLPWRGCSPRWSIFIQDNYNVDSVDTKKRYVQAHADKALDDHNPDHLYVNFTSGYVPMRGRLAKTVSKVIKHPVPHIKRLSNRLNPFLYSILFDIDQQRGRSSSSPLRLGIVIADYTTKELCQAIYSFNFPP